MLVLLLPYRVFLYRGVWVLGCFCYRGGIGGVFYLGCVPASAFWYSWVIFMVVMYVAAVRMPVAMMGLYSSQ